MPQMFPLLWTFLYIYFILIFMLFNIMNFYNFNKIIKSKKKNFINLKNFNMNWKW
uniref:ATP synthase F0 subunit 8 n=1 Tax=Birmella discoidalisa TaxID=2060665 RepID=A0A2H4ZQU9_9HYME|nr:ATP synthase F0 subunit 8 [Birmella discoidalisa]